MRRLVLLAALARPACRTAPIAALRHRPLGHGWFVQIEANGGSGTKARRSPPPGLVRPGLVRPTPTMPRTDERWRTPRSSRVVAGGHSSTSALQFDGESACRPGPARPARPPGDRPAGDLPAAAAPPNEPDHRRAFESARIRASAPGTVPGWTVDALAARPVALWPGPFDAPPDSMRAFWGALARGPLPTPLGKRVLRRARRRDRPSRGTGVVPFHPRRTCSRVPEGWCACKTTARLAALNTRSESMPPSDWPHPGQSHHDPTDRARWSRVVHRGPAVNGKRLETVCAPGRDPIAGPCLRPHIASIVLCALFSHSS